MDYTFRNVSVEIVRNHSPFRGRSASCEQRFQEAGVVLLGTGIADGADDFAAGYVESRDQRLSAVADVFELTAKHLAWLHWQIRRSALQRLHAGHLVDRDGADVLLRRRGCVVVDGADISALALELRIRLGREPAAHAMRLDVGIFLKSARPAAPAARAR